MHLPSLRRTVATSLLIYSWLGTRPLLGQTPRSTPPVRQALTHSAARASAGLRQSEIPDSIAERNRRWRVDIAYLMAELPVRHIRAFHDVDSAAFRRAIDTLRADVPRLSDDEIVVSIMRIVALIGDGHTNVDWMSRFRSTPVALGWFPEGIAVTHAALGYDWLFGARVVRVNGVSTDSAMVAAATLVSREPGAEEKARYLAPFILQFPAIVHALRHTDADSLTLEVELASGGARRVTLPASMSRQQWLGMIATTDRHEGLFPDADPEVNYWSRIFARDRALYIRYSFCGEGRPSFADFAAQALVTIDSAELTRVIIDLRGNAGGNSEIMRPLIEGLANRPALRQRGSLIVLLDRGVYSSAILNATELHQRLGAIYIGEAPGAAAWHYGEIQTLVLPNSQLRIAYPTKFEGYGPRDTRLIQPEVRIITSLDSFRSGEDPILRAALQFRPRNQ
jgi:hypothetical protein